MQLHLGAVKQGWSGHAGRKLEGGHALNRGELVFRFTCNIFACVKRGLCVWWMLMLGLPAVGQQDPCTSFLRVRVLDAETRQPLADAQVHQHFDDGRDYIFLTNSRGWVQLPGCTLPFAVHVDYLGYASADSSFQVLPGVQLVILLHPDPLMVAETAITEKRLPTPADASIATQSLSGSELAAGQGGTLGQALAALPGVTTLSTGPTIAKPVVHGQQGNRVVILNNGVRQEAQQWGSEHGPEIDPFLATRLTVVKGPAAIRYGGDAIGGVVLVEPPALPTTPKIGGVVQGVGMSNGRLLATSAMLEGGLQGVPGLAWRAQGTYRRAGDLKAPDYYLNNTGIKEANFSLAAGYSAARWHTELFFSRFGSEVAILGAAHIGNLTDLQASIRRASPLVTSGYSREIDLPYQDINHELLKSSTSVQAGRGILQVVYAWQRNTRSEYDFLLGLPEDVPALQFTINTHTLDVNWQSSGSRLGPGTFRASLGLLGLRQHNTWEGRFLIPFYIRYAGGAYAHAHWQDGRSLWEAGIRYEYQYLNPKFNNDGIVREEEHRFQPLTGALSWQYTLKPGVQLETSAGLAVRPPYVNELYSDGVHHGSGIYEVGDTALVPERALKTSLAIRLRPVASSSGLRKALSVDIQLYRDQVYDYIVLAGLPEPVLTVRGAYPAFGYSQSDATFYGADASLTADLTPHLRYTLRGSWVRTNDSNTGYAVPFTPADRYQQALSCTVQGGGRIQTWFVEINSLAVTRTQGFANYEGLDPATPEFILQTRDYAPPPPGYALWGAAVGGTLALGKHLRMEVRLAADNLLNTTYRDYLDRFRYYVAAPGRNIRLQLRIPFGARTD